MKIDLAEAPRIARAPIPADMPFFIQDGDCFVPTEASAGYWRKDTLTGRVIGGILGFVLDRDFAEPDLVPARFTVDLLRLPPMEPIRVVTRVIKGGGRLKLVGAECYAGETLVAQATCQFLRRSTNPARPTWQTPTWGAPPPHTLRPDARPRHWDLRPIPDLGRRPPAPMADAPPPTRGNPPVLGALAPLEARQAWVRETRELVAGFSHTPFARVALAADFASPLANSGEHGIDFVNADFTVYLHRLPQTEWLGFELVKHHATDGVAIGECWIYDEAGPVGTATVAGLAQQQR